MDRGKCLDRQIFSGGRRSESDNGAYRVRVERREVLEDLADGGAFGKAGENSADGDPGRSEDRLSATGLGILVDVLSVVEAHGRAMLSGPRVGGGGRPSPWVGAEGGEPESDD